MKISSIKRVVAVAAAALCACVFAGCALNGLNDPSTEGSLPENYSSMRSPDYYKFNTPAYFVVTADFTKSENIEKLNALGARVQEYLNVVEASLSTTVSTSYIARFNAAEPGAKVQLDEMSYTVLEEAVRMYEFTNGYYNPAVYYSVDLFGFSPRFNNETHTAQLSTKTPYDRVSGNVVNAALEPDEHYVSIFKQLASHMDGLELVQEDGKYYAIKPDVTVYGLQKEEYTFALDLGGIGKGYAADAVNAMIHEAGFEYGFCSFGSSSISILKSADSSQNNNWQFNLTDPDMFLFGGTYARMYAQSTGLSSSGDYEKCYKAQDGVNTYCHIIDPFTGRPKTLGIAACTLTGKNAAYADCLTTALLVMGEEKAVEFINNKLKDCRVTMIVRGSGGACEHIVSNVPDLEYNPQYTLANTLDDEGNIILKG